MLGTSSQAVFWKFGLLGSLLQPKDVHQIREDTPASKTHSAHMCTSYTSCNYPSALSSSTELRVELLAEEVKELTLVDIDKGRWFDGLGPLEGLTSKQHPHYAQLPQA